MVGTGLLIREASKNFEENHSVTPYGKGFISLSTLNAHRLFPPAKPKTHYRSVPSVPQPRMPAHDFHGLDQGLRAEDRVFLDQVPLLVEGS